VKRLEPDARAAGVLRATGWRDVEPEVGLELSTFRLRVGCLASIWSAPDGSSLLTWAASSVQTAPDGYRRIIWMIKRMIKGHPTKNRMPRRATLVVDHRTPAMIDRLVHPPDRVDRLTAGPRSPCLSSWATPFELAPHSTAGRSPNSSSSNSWRSSISPSASGSPPASNGSRLAHSMASSIDFT
jgi:hypothetical protein